MTREQKPVVWPTLLRWPTNSRRRNGNLSNLVTIQMEILAGSGQSHCPLPRYVSRSPLALSCRVPVLSSDQQHPLLPPETGTETLPVRLQSSRIVSWRVSEGEMNELSGHIQSQTPATFSFVLPEKMVIYLPHSSAWAMNVHRNQNSETLHGGVQCSESVVP